MNRQTQQKVTKTLWRNLIIVVCMFGFAFALVPLYQVFCDITGLNGRNSNLVKEASQIDEIETDTTRLVRVQFDATNNINMPWEFRPMTEEIRLHPGEIKTVLYYAHNPTNEPMVAQIIPSVSPGRAASYLRKVECFCFEQQRLGASESVEMAVRFYVHKAIPADVKTLTLSYTIFDITAETDKTALVKDAESQDAHIHEDGSAHYH